MSDDARAQGPAYRMPHHGGMDPATRRLAVIAASLGGALFVVIGAWTMLGTSGGPVPVISPPDAPVRVKPANPGGLKITNSMALFGAGLTDASGDKLAPAPETPDPQALHQPAPPPAAKPAPQVAAPSVSSAPLAPPTPAAAQPQVKTEALPAAPNPAPAAPHPAAAPPAAPAHSAAASGGRQVQLAALPTRDEAEKEWRLIAHKTGKLLDGHSPDFSEAVVNGRTWWRVRTGGFADEAAARAFCDQLRATGAACSLARF